MDTLIGGVGSVVPTLQTTRIGMITPSSNTALEPLTQAMLAPLYPSVSAHFQRFRVEKISLEANALAQFDTERLLDAARLLADANVQVVAWNGTSAGWLGLEADHDLVRAIESEIDAKATTTTLALIDAFQAFGARRIGLVTPYLDGVQSRVISTFADAGFETVAERHLGDAGNFSYGLYSSDQIAELVREVAEAGPDVIAIFCTGLRGAPLAKSIEAEFGIPVIDSVSVTVWKTLALAGASPSAVSGWGRLFDFAPGSFNLAMGDRSHD